MAKWRHRSGSTLAQVMAWCHQAPSHYLNQCWRLINKVQWHSPESNLIVSTHRMLRIKMSLKIVLDTFTSPWGQWVKSSAYFCSKYGVILDCCYDSTQMYFSMWQSLLEQYPGALSSVHCNSFEDQVLEDFIYYLWPLLLRKLTSDWLNAHWKPMGV